MDKDQETGARSASELDTEKLMPMLTVLIPTWNRAPRLARLLKGLARIGLGEVRNIEVLIADNGSSDRTSAVARAAARRLKMLTYVHFNEHLGSAEENINRAIPLTRGEYVWILGDDDLVVAPTVNLLLELVACKRADCFIFDNTRAADSAARNALRRRHGSVTFEASSVLVMGANEAEGQRYQDLIQQYGLTSAMAFISRYVFRRAAFVSWSDYLRLSPIYAHVFGFARMFQATNVYVVGRAIVERTDSKVLDRFKMRATKANEFLMFPWTLGLIRLARKAEAEGALRPRFLSSVEEISEDGGRYRLSDEMFMQLCRQCRTYIMSGDPREKLTTVDLDEFFAYFREEKGWVSRETTLKDIHRRITTYSQAGRALEIPDDVKKQMLSSLDELMTQVSIQARNGINGRSRIYLRIITKLKRQSVVGRVATALLNSERIWLGKLLRAIHGWALANPK